MLKKHCRIGRVKMKNGGADLTILPTNEEKRFRHLFGVASWQCAKEKVLCAGYFVKYKNGGVEANWANEDGVYASDLTGSAAHLQHEIYASFKEKEK